MGTSTVTQAREPQKVGEPYSLNRTKKPRNCVKTQMMQRDSANNRYFSFFIIFWEFQFVLGREKCKFFTAGVAPDSEGKVRGRKMGREALFLCHIVSSRWGLTGRL